FGAFDVLTNILFEESHDGGTTWSLDEQVNDAFAFQLASHGGDLFAARSDGLFTRTVITASVGPDPGDGSLRFSLAGPQPVRDEARFRFVLPVAADATLELFDLTGRRVAERSGGFLSAGPHELALTSRALPAGVYAARLTSGARRESVRVVRAF